MGNTFSGICAAFFEEHEINKVISDIKKMDFKKNVIFIYSGLIINIRLRSLLTEALA